MSVFNSLLTLFLIIGCAACGALLFPPPKGWPDTEPTDPFDSEAPNTGASVVSKETHQ